MMIAGHVTIEDLWINFRVTQGEGPAVAHVTVGDRFTGQEESYQTDARGFMIALGAALDFDGGEWMPEGMREQMERAQPQNPGLRFIP